MKTTTVEDVIDEEKIWNILAETKNPTEGTVQEILQKAALKQGLSLTDVGSLLNTDDPEVITRMFQTAGKIKQEIYGERLVFFAPLYISSFCVNDCDYCGFHRRNPAPRKRLSLDEVVEQTKILADMGHKRLLLEFGEHPKESPIDYVTAVIQAIYGVRSRNGEIRRVNVNIAATTTEEYRKIKAAGIGTYQLFQETYHPETYVQMHHGPKADFERQLFAHDRAMAAGIDDVGLGVLFGLFDHRFDILGLVSHSQYLEKTYGIGPHTISVPRCQPADTVQLPSQHQITEEQLLKAIAILRMAVPYAGMIITTRERPEIRAKAFQIGISQTSAASRTYPGGYGSKNGQVEQFHLQDHRSLDAVVHAALQEGLIPSFCTACYRVGRTGEKIMSIIKAGQINMLCRPNALLTLQEYLEDYASPEVQALGRKVTEHYLQQIPGSRLRRETRMRLERIENGERDIYF